MDSLEKVVEESHAEYTEARYHKREKTHIIIRKSELEDIKNETHSGVGIRVLHGGTWGFSSVNSVKYPALKETLSTAIRMAETASDAKKKKVHLQEVSPVQGRFVAPVKDPLEDHSLEEKIDLCVHVDKSVLSNDKIRSSLIYYEELLDSKCIITSDGSQVSIQDSKPQIFIGAVAGAGSDLVSYVDSYGTTGGWEIFREHPIEPMIEKATTMARDLLDAPYPKGGKSTVILDPGLVGLLSHEAVGHTMEADTVLSGAVTKTLQGKKVASECVTMVDAGLMKGGGWIPVDDEGVACENVTLIDRGVVKGFLHNRETAFIMNTTPTGNARAWEYDYEPLIRMRNTYIEPGTWDEDEIIEETIHGFFLKGARTGQADVNAEFVFQVKEAYEVHHGEIGQLLRSVTLMGNAFDVLKTVDAVGKTFALDMGFGVCMKGQLASVDGGGPHLRCSLLVGGT
jgi:TldD protein